MMWEWSRLTCAVNAQVATLTTTTTETQAHPGGAALAAGGIVVNLTANVAEFFVATASSGSRYRVTIERES